MFNFPTFIQFQSGEMDFSIEIQKSKFENGIFSSKWG